MDGQVCDIFRSIEFSCRRNAHSFLLDIDTAGINHHVLLLQGRDDALIGDAQLGQLSLGGFKIDDLWLNTPELDPGHPLY